MPAVTPETPGNCLPLPAPDAYRTEEELTVSLAQKGTFAPPSGLYPRDGTEEVTAIEAAISETTIPDQRLNVVVPSGMAAVSGAVRFAMSLRGRELDRPPTLAHAKEVYPQTTASVNHLKNMGVAAKGFDSGSPMNSLQFGFGHGLPDVVMAETVANTPSMPVMDVFKLLKRARSISASGSDSDPILIFDNTLLLKTGLDFEEILKPDDRALVVESVTKGRLHNSGHRGVVYSNNEELMDEFRKFKITEGLVTSTNAGGPIMESLEATVADFDDRNIALYAGTGAVALGLARAQAELGSETDFVVSFPTLDAHPNKAYSDKVLVNGVAPVVFMGTTQLLEGASRNLLKRIAEHPAVLEQIDEGQVFLGQSFGFPEARMLYDPNACQVRIAGGHNIDNEALAEALYTAAVDI